MGICVSCRRRDLQAQDKRAARAGGGRAPAKGAAAELLLRRADPAMANSISNIKMTNPIKGFVSKRRRRYMKDGFNLDLAYITDRLIAMGFPAEKLEGVYRNHIDEVYRFLEQMHKDHYKIYNLCSERCYDSSKFHGRVARYAFEDHTPPKMELIQPFCEDVHSWLAEDPRNVAAVHCKAGKGRTGTMLCCYLLYSGQKATADEALKYYGNMRTYDDKGVTIPSQRRYVEYYAEVVRRGLQYRATKLHIRELLMSPPPALSTPQCTLELTVSPHNKTAAVCHEVRKASLHTRLVLEQCTPLHGDVRVDVYSKPKMMRKEKLFHFWFNTFFVANCVGAVRVPPPADSMNLETYKLTLNKWQLDDAHKDKQHKLYSPDFKVELVVQQQPASSRALPAPARAPSPPSSASSASSSEPEPEDSEHWDSGEQPAEPTHAYLDFGRRCRCESETVNAYVPLDRQTDRQSRFDSTVIDPPLPLGTLDGTNKPGGLASRCRDLFRPISPERMDVPCDCIPDQKRKKNAKCNKLHMNCLDSKDGKDAKKLESRVGKDGYILIDRTPRPPVAPDCEMRPEPPLKSEISDPTGTRKGKHIGKDGYMLVDATPRRPPRPINSKLPATSTDDFYEPDPRHVDSRDETYMEFTTADGCIKPVEQTKTSFEDEYAFVDPELSELTDDPNSMLADVSPKPDGVKSKPSKNKKHSFFKRDDYKNEKGKIPKVSSDHTISDSKNDKKAGRFFNRREDEGSKPKLSLFSVKWPENRKKKDRDDS